MDSILDVGLEGILASHSDRLVRNVPSNVEILNRQRTLASLCPLDNSRVFMKAPPESKTLGRLLSLPKELQQHIVADLDIATLTTLRAVHSYARDLVDSDLSSQKIIKFCPTVVRALLSTQLAQFFICKDLLKALQSRKCFVCPRFGQYIYLFRCQRVCASCLYHNSMLAPLPTAEAMKLYGLRPRHLAPLRKLFAPRRFCVGYEDESFEFVDRNEVRIVAMGQHHPRGNHDTSFPLTDVSAYGRPRSNMQSGRFRHSAVVRLPWLDSSKDSVESGYQCQGCYDTATHNTETLTVYSTKEECIRHLRDCVPTRAYILNAGWHKASY
jgi:hypothetical protein